MARPYQALTEEQVEQFLTRGHIVLHDCFSREWAEEMTSHAFTRLGYDPDDRSTWKQARVHMPNVSFYPMQEYTPKAWAAICDLMGGEERIVQPCQLSDGFIVNFAIGADRPYQPPSQQSPGWHKDGGFFRHYLDSPEQGLLTLVYWSDVPPQGGGTLVACDSVAPVARYLLDHPEGIVLSEFNFGPLIRECHDIIETRGQIGDIVLLHPYILHASSQNLSGKARFLTNPPIQLKEPMNFNRENPDDFSLVELAILRALGVDRLDYHIQGPRERIHASYMDAQAKLLAEEKARLAAAAH